MVLTSLRVYIGSLLLALGAQGCYSDTTTLDDSMESEVAVGATSSALVKTLATPDGLYSGTGDFRRSGLSVLVPSFVVTLSKSIAAGEILVLSCTYRNPTSGVERRASWEGQGPAGNAGTKKTFANVTVPGFAGYTILKSCSLGWR